MRIYWARRPPSRTRRVSVVRTVGYGASQRGDALHLLFLREKGGVEEHGVGGLNGLRGVARIALHDLIGLFGDFGIGRPASQSLDEAASSPLPWIGDEKDLERPRPGKTAVPMFAPVHDDVMLRRRVTHAIVDPDLTSGMRATSDKCSVTAPPRSSSSLGSPSRSTVKEVRSRTQATCSPWDTIASGVHSAARRCVEAWRT